MPLKNPFRSTWNNNQLLNDIPAALIPGQFVELGRTAVTAGVAVELGHGSRRHQTDSLGRIFIDLQDANNPIDGMLRIDLHNPQNRVVRTIFEGRTESLRNANANDRRTQIPMPEEGSAVGQDWAIVMKINSDDDDPPTDADSTVLVDVTTYDV